jgi:hypothetical protein
MTNAEPSRANIEQKEQGKLAAAAEPFDSAQGKRLEAASRMVADDIIQGQEKAAKYAGVTTKTIQRWEHDCLKSWEVGRRKCYSKTHLKLFKDSEGASENPHRRREQIATADIKETTAELKKIALGREKGEWVRTDEIERKNLLKINTVNRALDGQANRIWPFLVPFLKDPLKDGTAIRAIIRADGVAIRKRFAQRT